jgi:hypothetical protein
MVLSRTATKAMVAAAVRWLPEPSPTSRQRIDEPVQSVRRTVAGTSLIRSPCGSADVCRPRHAAGWRVLSCKLSLSLEARQCSQQARACQRQEAPADARQRHALATQRHPVCTGAGVCMPRCITCCPGSRGLTQPTTRPRHPPPQDLRRRYDTTAAITSAMWKPNSTLGLEECVSSASDIQIGLPARHPTRGGCAGDRPALCRQSRPGDLI